MKEIKQCNRKSSCQVILDEMVGEDYVEVTLQLTQKRMRKRLAIQELGR